MLKVFRRHVAGLAMTVQKRKLTDHKTARLHDRKPSLKLRLTKHDRTTARPQDRKTIIP